MKHFEFENYRNFKAIDNDTSDDINEIKLEDMKKLKNIIDNDISLEEIIKNPKELMPTTYIGTIQGKERFDFLKNMIMDKVKHIPDKKFYPKNFFLYGDSRTGKTTIA